MDSGLPLVDEYLEHIFDIGHTSSHNLGRFSAYSAANILGWGLYEPKTSHLCDSHIYPHVTLPIKASPLRDEHTTNMALSKSTCTTSILQIANNEEHSYAPSLPPPCLRATIFVPKKLLCTPTKGPLVRLEPFISSIITT